MDVVSSKATGVGGTTCRREAVGADWARGTREDRGGRRVVAWRGVGNRSA